MSLINHLREAAFWGESVCADCGLVVEADTQGSCAECGSVHTLPAATALRVLALAEAAELAEELEEPGF